MQKKKLVLLVNLGSPVSLDSSAIKIFLAKFLSDKKVVRLPKVLWYPILYGIILPIRAHKLVSKYQAIWDNGSPLINYTKSQAINFREYLASIGDDSTIVEYAFSYTTPMIDEVLDKYKFDNNLEICIIPMYPQFSSTTTLPIINQLVAYFDKHNKMMSFKMVQGFHNHELYIKLIVSRIKQFWQNNTKSEHLVFSYHSLPISIIKNGDSYYLECLHTTELIIHQLNLSPTEYSITFQSRFGAEKWLGPVTMDKLIEFAKSGIKSIDIICPGFICDCLETLEEIAIQNMEQFLLHGGDRYNYIPCINDDRGLNQLLLELIK